MYERFTDRARKVMELANQETRRFNHEYIGTEHILLGLIKEGSGVGANVLKNLDIDLRKIRLEVEKIVQPGPDRVTTGKLPMTPRAKKVIEYSIEEARSLNHNYVGTEHLLLGLIREESGVAAEILKRLGLGVAVIRESVLSLLSHHMQSTAPVERAIPLQSQDLSNRISCAATLLQTVIDLISDEKEDSVAAHDFERAAHLRDKEAKLQEIHQWLAANKDKET